MTVLFSQNIYKNLIQNGFRPVEGFTYREELHSQNKFTSLIKTGGPVWYVVVLINGDLVSEGEFINLNRLCTNYFTHIQQENRIRNLFIVNLIYTQSYVDGYVQFILKQKSFQEESVNNIYWSIVMENGDFIYNSQHPTQVLNLRKLIDASYSASLGEEGGGEKSIFIKNLNEVAFSEIPYKEKVKKPMIPYIFIIINIIVFFIMELSGGTKNIENLVRFGALIPLRFMTAQDSYRLITSMFIHIGFMHLFFNCFSLYIFGTRIEKYYGRSGFLIIYFFSGVIGALFSLLLTNAVSAGASGAIYGLVGAMAVLTNKSQMVVEGLNYYTMIVYIIVGIGLGFTVAYIDNYGHIGGLIGGIIAAWLILKIFESRNKE